MKPMLEALVDRLQSHNHRRVIGVIALLLLFVWGSVAAWSLMERHNALAANAQVQEELNAAVQSQTQSLFKQAEVSLMVARHWMEAHPTQDPSLAPEFIALVQQLRTASGGLLDIRLATRAGLVRYVPRTPETDNVRVDDREYFKAQAHPETRGFHIGKPVRSKVSGKWGIPVSAPVDVAGGDIGVLFMLITYDRIAAIFDGERLEPSGTIGIASKDGEIIFRSPLSESAIGKSLAKGAGWAHIAAAPAKGLFESPVGIIDGVARLVAYAQVPGYPLLVYVSIGKPDVLRPWQQHTVFLVLVAALISLFALATGLALLRALTASHVAESIVRSADEAIIGKSLDGVVTSWNPGAERIFGYTADEMIGQSILRLIPAHLHDEEAAILSRIRQGQGVDHLETERLCKDGRSIVVSLTAAPIRDALGRLVGASKIARDITSEKAASAQLKLTASVFTNTSEGILITNSRGRIVEVNEAFTQITGYSRDEVMGHSPSTFHARSQGSEVFRAMRRALRQSGQWRGELWSRKKDGQAFAAWLTVTQVRGDRGEVPNYVVLFSDITVLKLQQEELEHGAHFDALTDLPNRLLLSDRLHQAMTLCQRQNQSLAVLYLDLDGFKQVNDLYGHETGDALLVALSRRMKAALRDVDTLARMGGDEFVAVLSGIASTQDCIQLVTRVLAACAEPVHVQGHEVQVTASIGVTLYPQDSADADLLMRHADQAMYEAKQSGKNKYHLFDSAQDAEAKSRAIAQDDVARGLAHQEFVLFYQPKVHMQSGAIIGFEALVRWRHPARGLLLPGAFLPAIERHALNEALGAWVLDTALAQMSQWQVQGLKLSVSVNIAARQLQQPDFATQLADLLADHSDVEPHLLELEVLETSALEDIAMSAKILQECHRQGVRFAMDDFGTGYSSLTYLRHLPVETLKIDQSFVRDMLEDQSDLSIVRGVIGLAAAFHREVIAEGVESVAHGQRLIELGCALGQGYAIARPMPADQVVGWCQEWTPPLAWTQG
ncbi:EAL domain-containing protein [Rhodoferax lacus]|nr:EAL domain-containing protein [Rhodoferax lacus]